MNTRIRLARGLVTFTAVFLAIVPLVADLNESHVFHPEWTGHARLHTVWLLGSNSLVCLVALFWMWRARAEEIPRAIGLGITLVACVLAGFFIAAGTQALYGGSLTDLGDDGPKPGGVNPNLAAFSVHACILGVALYLLRTSRD